MKLSSVTLLASLLPSNSLAGKAQGFLLVRQNGAKAAQVTTDDVPCFAPEEFGSFDVTITEDATTFGDCRAEFFKLLKEKMVAEGCSLESNAANKELEYHLNLGDESTNRYINAVCQHARDHQPTETFYDITSASPRAIDLVEFFDGGSHLNEEIGSLNNEDGNFINNYYDQKAANTLVELPDLHMFDHCTSSAIMCCWVQDRHNENAQNNGNCRSENGDYSGKSCYDKDPADNTDICYVDLEKSRTSNHVRGGQALFHDDFDDSDSETEGRAHCHGFAWKDSGQSPSRRYRGNNLFYVSMYDHLHQRGYTRNVLGAAMCSCVDDSPVVSQSDCTEMRVSETYKFQYNAGSKKLVANITNVDIKYNACTGINEDNDLEDYYRRLVRVDEAVKESREAVFNETIVGDDNCRSAIISMMAEKGWQRIP